MVIDLQLSSRLAGVMMIVPVINFWWPSFPPKLASEVFKQQLKRDQWKLWIAHHTPALLYWWMNQKLFPYSSIMQRHPILLNERDLKTIQAMSKIPNPDEVALLPSAVTVHRIVLQEQFCRDYTKAIVVLLELYLYPILDLGMHQTRLVPSLAR